ncbi:hypothetical protein [Candidatus Poriferisocius sp.]|uniref:hypothetical protein n=1 Tax=Candidatus Poriferisocius sp. TaxID=3101276 RepID=UPI003B5BEEBE
MVAWVQGWSEVGMEPVHGRAGLGGTGAHVFGDAIVSDGAWVFEQAKVFGEAEISDQARVYEHAQVFDQTYVYGNARVYGNAKAFSYPWSEYISGRTGYGEPIYSPVFQQGDVALNVWTVSHLQSNEWGLSIAEIEARYVSGDWNGATIAKEDASLSDTWNKMDGGMSNLSPTRIYGNARAFGKALVWGSSELYGSAKVYQDARLSGGGWYYGSGRLCGTFWHNGERDYVVPVCDSKEALWDKMIFSERLYPALRDVAGWGPRRFL